ncbi:MAG: NTP transferase domain-containing protein [Clostridia bacterium]|nr:NTP transferase domain-containing protein [Clostridia bacterium]
MKAIIMAGGEGSRLRPLTCRRPKPLVPVANRPVMEYCLELLRDLGIKEVGVTLQYLPAMIEEFFGDGSDYGLRLHYYVEDKPLGTAGSVRNAAPLLDETFIVISGDALTDFDLRPALQQHRESGALATLVLTTVDNPLEYGVVITNSDGSIRSFLEKPSWGEVFSDRVNTGIYILEPEILEQIPTGRSYDFSKDLFPKLLKAQKPLYGVTLDGYWCDIGNLSQYRQAQEDILHGRVKVKVLGAEQGKGIMVGDGAEIDPEAQLEGPILIGEYCHVGSGAVVGPGTVLGPYTRVETGASLKKTIVWDNVYIGAGASLRGAVVCSNSRISKQVQVFEDAVIGDACRVETGVEVRQQVKVWPQKCLGQETVLSESLIWGQGTARPLFVGSQVAGHLNGELAPSRVIRLGMAYGNYFKPGAMVGLSTFNDGVGELLYKAMAAGLMTAGVKVADLGYLLTPLHRFAVRSLGLAGGCHIKPDAAETAMVRLHLVNERGHDLPPGAVRKIENLYWREDGRQAGAIETSVTYPAIKAAYKAWLLSTLKEDGLKKQPVKIALGSQRLAAELAAEVLQQAGAEVIRLDFDPAKDWPAVQEHIPFFTSEIQRFGAELGAIIEPNGEELLLFNNSGRRITTAQQLALLARVYLELKAGASLVLPVTAPRALELLAERLGGRVERVKSHPGIHQESMERIDGKDLLGQQHLQLDALAALLHILDWLARQRLSLAAAVAQLPPIYTAIRTVPCPWEAKGRVMRTLINQEPAERVELLDGVQVKAEKGWTLVLPDGETPHYRIYSEAFSQEAAEELAVRYEQRLQELIAGA